MSLQLDEQEIVINALRTDEYAKAYISDKTWMTKFNKLVEENPKDFKILKEETYRGEVISRTYQFPKKYITIRKKGREISDEQKEAASERFKKMWEKKKQITEDDIH